MNELSKKNIFKQNRMNVFAMMIGFVIGLSLLSYSKAQQQNYELPTGNNYSVGRIREPKIGQKSETGGNTNIAKSDGGAGSTEKRIITPRVAEDGGHGDAEKTDKGGSKLVLVKGFPEDSLATKIATYAYEVSSGDINFLATLKAENGAFDMYKQSNVVKNGVREDSWGLCQLHRGWYKDIVDSKIFWESWEYQVEICYDKYKGGTKFYGYNVRHRYLNDFTILSE